MNYRFDRRAFLQLAAGATAVAASTGSHAVESEPGEQTPSGGHAKWRKALKYTMLPKALSDEEKFKLAKECGFEGIDGSPMDDHDAAKRQAELAAGLGVPIHGLVFGGWHAPLSDPNPETVKKGIDGMTNALKCARAIGVNTVLLVPAVVNDKVRYAEAYERSQENVRKLIPVAEETGVVIAIENVWNKFLLSPIEFARYLDEFNSPWVKAYFDIGNVVIFGWPEDWIRTLGKRIVKCDVKDFRRKDYKFMDLKEGDVNFPEVLKALDEIGFKGWITAEYGESDKEALTKMGKAFQEIIAG